MTDGWIAIPVYLVFLVISNIMSLPGKYYVVGKDDKTPSKIAYKIAIVKDALLQRIPIGPAFCMMRHYIIFILR